MRDLFFKPSVGIIKKIVCTLLIWEFVLTGIGFCGHHHDHGSHPDKCLSKTVYSSSDHTQSHFHTHVKDDDCCRDQEESYGETRCSCLGGFIATPLVFPQRIILMRHPISHDVYNMYDYHYSASIYRPPISHI
jgi:disulfide bond formation protein DsbB